jgi:hypothetical protein
MRWIVLLAVALVAACGGSEDDLVTREELVGLFAAAGEPLELRADVAAGHFGPVAGLSDLDAVYVPEGTGDGAAAFTVALRHEGDPEAERAAESLASSESDPRVAQLDPIFEKNVVLLAFGVDVRRRARLVAIVESL